MASSSRSSTLLGRTLGGRFLLNGLLGEGAMAVVYRGVQEAEPRQVAVKVMHAHLQADPTFVSRFRREARAASLLDHPNTVRILDSGVDSSADGDAVYLAMELLGGQDLFELLVLERRLAEARAARLMLQVCSALIAAHALGVIHRDLKPENIRLVPGPAGEERVKVLDFGIAKILDRGRAAPGDGDAPVSLAPASLTTVGTVVGTPHYMSPEQCRGEPVDARTDVYACGVLLYQLVTGHLPFEGDNPLDLVLRHLRDPPPAPSSLTPDLHPGLEAVILRALAKWPAQRQASAAALRDELTRLLPELSSGPLAVAASLRDAPPSLQVDSRLPTPVLPTLRRLPSLGLDLDELRTLRSVSPLEEPREPPSGVAPRPVAMRPARRPPIEEEGAPSSRVTLAPQTIRSQESPAPATPQRSPAPRREAVSSSPPDPGRRSATTLNPRRQRRTSLWIVGPLAVLCGAVVGVVAFLLLR